MDEFCGTGLLTRPDGSGVSYPPQRGTPAARNTWAGVGLPCGAWFTGADQEGGAGSKPARRPAGCKPAPQRVGTPRAPKGNQAPFWPCSLEDPSCASIFLAG